MSQRISKEGLSNYYTYMRALYEKARQDVLWHFGRFLDESKPISDFRDSIRVISRVKPEDSIFRKCNRDNVSLIGDIPVKIEDLIGIRAATANKEQARVLFETLERLKDNWFCLAKGLPKFVPYTVAERSKYSLQSGYQAYHVTFVFSQSYKPITEEAQWPVEIQVMSQLWEFWADYSRRYFYGATPTKTTSTYNVVVSKLLDAADDLMIATTDAFRQQKKSEALQS
jgi:ppGpp synthetase/RelA/SpoT-type nucleotidyltranferase